MDEHKSPEDILDEIMNRTTPSEPVPPRSSPPRFDPPEDDPPLQPEKPEQEKRDPSAKFIVLAAGLVILAILLLALNAKLGEMEKSMEGIQLMDSLQEEKKRLEREYKVLQQDKERSDQEAQRAQSNFRTISQNYQDLQKNNTYQQVRAELLIQQSQYLWFIEQFLEAGDYPMAAAVMVAGNNAFQGLPSYQNPDWAEEGMTFPGLNFLQQEQYDEVQETLIARGYLQLNYDQIPLDSTPDWSLGFTEKWNPTGNPDMTGLMVLWSILDKYFVERNDSDAAQWIVGYNDGSIEPDVPGWTALEQHINRAASPYTLRLYERMIQELVEQEYLVETEDGYETGPNVDSLDIYNYVYGGGDANG